MKNLILIWRIANGKKTVLAALAGVALAWAQTKHLVDDVSAVYLTSALAILTGVAVSHKAVKATNKEAK